MAPGARGFSLVEIIVALIITLGIGIIVFQLFHQNERVFRDQNLIVEMQQSARVVASQIADEVRMAGEGVPIYASTFDSANTEPVAAILATSTGDRIDFRAGLGDTETNVTTAAPIDLTLDASAALMVGNGSVLSTTLGTSTPAARFVYIWGPTSNSMWTWVRAELIHIDPTTLILIPRQGGDAGRTGDVIRFTQTPTVSLEQAVSFSLSGASIRRSTATGMTNQTNPTWSPANEIGRNFTSLVFTYYDKNNNVVTPNSLDHRLAIARVDVRVTAQTAEALSDGSRRVYPLSLRTIPRNVRVR